MSIVGMRKNSKKGIINSICDAESGSVPESWWKSASLFLFASPFVEHYKMAAAQLQCLDKGETKIAVQDESSLGCMPKLGRTGVKEVKSESPFAGNNESAFQSPLKPLTIDTTFDFNANAWRPSVFQEIPSGPQKTLLQLPTISEPIKIDEMSCDPENLTDGVPLISNLPTPQLMSTRPQLLTMRPSIICSPSNAQHQRPESTFGGPSRFFHGRLSTDNNEPESHQCVACNKRFARRDSLRRHNLRAHSNGKTFDCKKCGKGFGFLFDLRQHEKTCIHGMEFPCPYKDCNKVYYSEDGYRRHLRQHKGILPYACVICRGRQFPDAWSFRAHLKRHIKGTLTGTF